MMRLSRQSAIASSSNFELIFNPNNSIFHLSRTMRRLSYLPTSSLSLGSLSIILAPTIAGILGYANKEG